MSATEAKIEEMLADRPDEVRAFVRELRAFFRSWGEPAYELVGRSVQSVNIGYGFTKKAWDCYAGVIVYKRHINISLPSGAVLPDPHGILHGTGSRVRHIKVKHMDDVRSDAVRSVLTAAREAAFAKSGAPAPGEKGVMTVILGAGEAE